VDLYREATLRPRVRGERGVLFCGVIQRQLWHADLGVTSVYLQGIDNTEVISTTHARRAPTMRASAGF
jgi:hypothetical protein